MRPRSRPRADAGERVGCDADQRQVVLTGVVLMGSSRASTEQLELSLRRTEKERSAAIPLRSCLGLRPAT